MRVCVFEDAGASRFDPLTLTRPAFDLWCGSCSLLDRQRRYFGATEVGLLVRPSLADWCRFLHPDAAVNDPGWPRGGCLLLVNARWLPPAVRPGDTLATPRVALADGQVAYLVVPSPGASGCLAPPVDQAVATWGRLLPQTRAGGRMIDRPWDLVTHNAEALGEDFRERSRGPGNGGAPHRLTVVGPPDRLFVDPGASLEPLVVADTTRGPVVIDRAVVHAFSRLEGPCYVGPGSQVLGARLRGSTVGPMCRVGGEVEASVLQGYSNKAHDGYLGHSYVGEWVNLGAGTQVSDLRNDYGLVRVPVAGEPVPTGLLKVGAFLGDHTKTGLNTLLNCGTVVGAFCHLLPWQALLPREIPSFCAFRSGRLEERTDFRQLFATAAAVLRRRGCAWTDAHAEFFLGLFEHTAAGRRAALSAREHRPGQGAGLP
jgi:UDP-N-acetylglucosamine diphosphorylase/glucosamine-1-phosphate N-acetyltransferase